MPLTEAIATDEFTRWYEGLGAKDREAVARYVDLLESKGTDLGHPYSSAIAGARHALRELRVQAGGRPLRVFYAFDPRRDVVLLVGGSKEGASDKRFYREFIPKAERIWEEYLAEQEREKP